MTAAERQRRHRAKQRRSVHFSSRTAEWETPQPFFDKLHSDFHFTLDVCATAENTKWARFHTKSDNGLVQWTGVCWLNPPYGRQIAP
jgi:DNA N-6-adenine-methyltransferase (Dam)